MFLGMMARPAAIRARSPSASIPSTAATYRISSVIRPRFACSIWVMKSLLDPAPGVDRPRPEVARSLVRGGGRAHLADDRHLDLPRVLHPCLDLLGQVGCQKSQLVVGHLLGTRDHADFPSRLDRV